MPEWALGIIPPALRWGETLAGIWGAPVHQAGGGGVGGQPPFLGKRKKHPFLGWKGSTGCIEQHFGLFLRQEPELSARDIMDALAIQDVGEVGKRREADHKAWQVEV